MPHEARALGTSLSAGTLHAAHDRVALSALATGTSLGGRLAQLRGRSVLVATKDQLTAALALIELDGVARRLVVCPPDVAPEHLPGIMATAGVDEVVRDGTTALTPLDHPREASCRTEWILLTSGTTGAPKMVVHTLASLTDAITSDSALARPAMWSTFYDVRRYGGLQIFLRAILGGGSLVLSSADESTGDFLMRAASLGVTHISGTPSHWRRALMSPYARRLAPHYVRLSGEIADQAILDHLRAVYPEAAIGHAFASTEAGVAFAVTDGRAGFPARFLDEPGAVEMKIADGSLRIRSPRTAERYLGADAGSLRDADGFVDNGDMVERRGDRYYFVGRRGGIINVGGLKVHPEEVEAVINSHPDVRMSLVHTRKNPITGALVVADVVLEGAARPELVNEVLEMCRRGLPRHKVPAAISVVPALSVAATGKIARRA
jgi:acyl-coenzyme A synthetase/AMP-(fatty) acid ligase